MAGNTALHIATSKNRLDLCAAIARYNCDMRAHNHEGATPLNIACSQLNVDIVKLLITAGADVNYGTSTVLTPLACVLQKADSKPLQAAKIARVLIENSVNVNLRLQDGSTPLIATVRCGNMEMLQELLRASTLELDARDLNTQVTALMIAAANRSLECCRLLVEQGADVNIADQAGRTALMFAIGNFSEVATTQVRAPSVEIVTLLLEADANPHALDSEGNHAMTYAQRLNATECIELLRKPQTLKVCALWYHLLF